MRAGAFQASRVYLGWRHVVVEPDPGPPPKRPAPPRREDVDPGWVAAQRREEARISRPFAVAGAGCAAAAGALLALGGQGLVSPGLAAAGAAAFALLAGWNGRALWRGRRALRAGLEAERRRVEAARAGQERQLAARQEEHARRFRDWRSRRRAFEALPQWFPVALADDIDRVDVLGGTLPGWSALLTMVAAPRLATGGEVTVVDLSSGAVAPDLISLAGQLGIEPLVWVLPADLPRFDLGMGLPPPALADVLAASAVADRDPAGQADPARDHAVIERVLQVLGDGAGPAEVVAGLRVLAQIGDPRRDIDRGLLTAAQLERLTALFGRGAADRVVIDRAWTLESRLRALERLGADRVPLPASDLRVIALDPATGSSGNALVGAYAVVALTHLLRASPPGEPWRHTVCLLGGERLRGDVLDGLCDACETSRTGLVVAYRSAPAHVRERLGRGNAAVAFMRLGNAEEAKAASEQIGAEHRFVLTQLTDTVGTSFTGTATDSYTSTVGDSDSVSASVSSSQTAGRSRGRGRSRADVAPFGQRSASGSREESMSRGVSDSLAVTEGISVSTSWGVSTAAAVGSNASLARTVQRSREFLVEAHELQQLPPSAIVVSYAGPHGRLVVMADANPGIAALPTATLLSPDEASQACLARPPTGQAAGRPLAGGRAGARPAAAGQAGRPLGPARDLPGPNLGPPPVPFDVRRRPRRG